MTIAYDKKTPHRFDVVGSFLRPAALRRARADFEAGTISRSELTAVEDDAIRDLVAKQKAAGLGVITDGEFRRATWHLDFMWGFAGIGHSKTETGLPFHGETAKIDDTYATGKIRLEGEHPFIEHFRFVQALEDENVVAKLTIPAPAQFLAQLVLPFNRAHTEEFYDNDAQVEHDLVTGYEAFLKQAFDAGCRNIQFDDCSWGMLCDEKAEAFFGSDAEGLKRTQEQFLSVNNRVLDARPEGLTINTHVCRGNYHSTYASSGGYEAVASTFFAREHADAFFLEYDDERSGGFAPLAQIQPGTKVVLGLITTKSPELEDKEQVIARIREAATYVPLEDLCLSPQCGFASCEIGNKLTEDEQWAKVALVREIAEEVWG